MKRLSVEICVCTKCVMNGAMDIIEAVEGLKKLKTQLRLNSQVDIVTRSFCSGADVCPLVCVNGERMEHSNSETVMAKIISLTSKDVK
ncbi:MAG: hypothetical protein PHD67_02640 [Oscillospiraceae bacterium]|nr:hypothetical protein [Oscillospiraceae bacterium]